MLSFNFNKSLVVAALIIFILVGCSSDNALNTQKSDATPLTQTVNTEEFDAAWSEEEKAIINIMYDSTGYSSDAWQKIAYHVFRTGKKDNPIRRNFDCKDYCVLALNRDHENNSVLFYVQSQNGNMYSFKSRKELDKNIFRDSKNGSTSNLLVTEFPITASLVDDAFFININDKPTIFIGFASDYHPATSNHLIQKTPLDAWEEIK